MKITVEQFHDLYHQNFLTDYEYDSLLDHYYIANSATRTIYFKYELIDFEVVNKFKLKVPKLIFLLGSLGRCRLFALNEKNQICYVPFPNVNWSQEVCIPNKSNPINSFFQTYFTFPWRNNLDKYFNGVNNGFNHVDQNQHNDYIDFYKNWENKGDLKLIPIPEFESYELCL